MRGEQDEVAVVAERVLHGLGRRGQPAGVADRRGRPPLRRRSGAGARPCAARDAARGAIRRARGVHPCAGLRRSAFRQIVADGSRPACAAAGRPRTPGGRRAGCASARPRSGGRSARSSARSCSRRASRPTPSPRPPPPVPVGGHECSRSPCARTSRSRASPRALAEGSQPPAELAVCVAVESAAVHAEHAAQPAHPGARLVHRIRRRPARRRRAARRARRRDRTRANMLTP